MTDRPIGRQGAFNVLVVMGVSGSGKTSVAWRLAERLGWSFADADDFQSPANIAKMRGGVPLTDEDRAPWLSAVAERIDQWRAKGANGVMTCSALRRAYRAEVIGARSDVGLVYLKGEVDLIRTRIERRSDHFMPPSLLDSQFAALEAPGPEEHPITISIDQSIDAIIEDIVDQLNVANSVAAS